MLFELVPDFAPVRAAMVSSDFVMAVRAIGGSSSIHEFGAAHAPRMVNIISFCVRSGCVRGQREM
jgi:hypothetical protein